MLDERIEADGRLAAAGGATVSVNVFDQAARFSVQSDPLGFLRWLIPGLDQALRFHGWLDTRTLPFPGDPDRTCDTVAELAAEGADPTARAGRSSPSFRPSPSPRCSTGCSNTWSGSAAGSLAVRSGSEKSSRSSPRWSA